KEVTSLKIGIKYSICNKLGEHNVFSIQVFRQKGMKEFLSMLQFRYIDIISHEEILKGYIKGMFLACGYMKDPKKEYAMDFFIDKKEIAEDFYRILLHNKKKVFITKKRNKSLVYLRNSEDIMDMLVLMGAMKQFFSYEETTMMKDLKNKTIREMNWEVANETKTLNTGNYQIKMIEYIEENMGLHNLTPVLLEAVKVRLEHPESSLQELADFIGISKSGIRNRFRRIEGIYEKLKEEA
ncbi:MAG: DNA-binding protein WhiA, partial [Fusobacterium necrophorum]|nr:DNA-binding protein WhiA [Fusobacterium necrophorum]